MDYRHFSTHESLTRFGEPRLSFFASNLYGELRITEINATMVDYAQIDAML